MSSSHSSSREMSHILHNTSHHSAGSASCSTNNSSGNVPIVPPGLGPGSVSVNAQASGNLFNLASASSASTTEHGYGSQQHQQNLPQHPLVPGSNNTSVNSISASTNPVSSNNSSVLRVSTLRSTNDESNHSSSGLGFYGLFLPYSSVMDSSSSRARTERRSSVSVPKKFGDLADEDPVEGSMQNECAPFKLIVDVPLAALGNGDVENANTTAADEAASKTKAVMFLHPFPVISSSTGVYTLGAQFNTTESNNNNNNNAVNSVSHVVSLTTDTVPSMTMITAIHMHIEILLSAPRRSFLRQYAGSWLQFVLQSIIMAGKGVYPNYNLEDAHQLLALVGGAAASDSVTSGPDGDKMRSLVTGLIITEPTSQTSQRRMTATTNNVIFCVMMLLVLLVNIIPSVASVDGTCNDDSVFVAVVVRCVVCVAALAATFLSSTRLLSRYHDRLLAERFARRHLQACCFQQIQSDLIAALNDDSNNEMNSPTICVSDSNGVNSPTITSSPVRAPNTQGAVTGNGGSSRVVSPLFTTTDWDAVPRNETEEPAQQQQYLGSGVGHNSGITFYASLHSGSAVVRSRVMTLAQSLMASDERASLVSSGSSQNTEANMPALMPNHVLEFFLMVISVRLEHHPASSQSLRTANKVVSWSSRCTDVTGLKRKDVVGNGLHSLAADEPSAEAIEHLLQQGQQSPDDVFVVNFLCSHAVYITTRLYAVNIAEDVVTLVAIPVTG
eukprot:PhM_4_TR13940/c0_g1_i1/m.5334